MYPDWVVQGSDPGFLHSGDDHQMDSFSARRRAVLFETGDTSLAISIEKKG
jgi:hypothetical protein